MQYGQPFPENGLYNHFQFIPSTGQFPVVNPEIVGEGDVTSLVYPDGSIQYYFQPRSNPFLPCLNKSLWIIRSISNPNINDVQKYTVPPYLLPNSTNESEAPQLPTNNNYQLRFHNDGCTSTSDLHCFVPLQRQQEWFSKFNSPTRPPDINQYLAEPCICSRPVTNSVSMMSLDEEPSVRPVKCECFTKPIYVCRNVDNAIYTGENIICQCDVSTIKTHNINVKSSKNSPKQNSTDACDSVDSSKANVDNKTVKLACECKDSDHNILKSNKNNLNPKVDTCDKQISTYTDQSSSYTCDQICGTTVTKNRNKKRSPPKSTKKEVKFSNSTSSTDCSCVCCTEK